MHRRWESGSKDRRTAYWTESDGCPHVRSGEPQREAAIDFGVAHETLWRWLGGEGSVMSDQFTVSRCLTGHRPYAAASIVNSCLPERPKARAPVDRPLRIAYYARRRHSPPTPDRDDPKRANGGRLVSRRDVPCL